MAKKSEVRHSAKAQTAGAAAHVGKSSTLHEGPRFTRLNYVLMGIGGLLLILGYIFISGGEQRGDHFDPSEIYHPMRVTVAPILILIGFMLEVVAVFYKSKNTPDQE